MPDTERQQQGDSLHPEVFATAVAIAADAHGDQVDKAGWPYILHPLRVGLAGRTDPERVVGFLHDVFEDSGYDARRVLLLGMPDDVVRTVEVLTKRQGECYEDYLARVKADPLARAVKLNDLADNLREDRVVALSEAMVRRYTRAQAFLLEEAGVQDETTALGGPGPAEEEKAGPLPLDIPPDLLQQVNLSRPFAELTLIHTGQYTGPTRGRAVKSNEVGFYFLTEKDGLFFIPWSNLAFWRVLPEV